MLAIILFIHLTGVLSQKPSGDIFVIESPTVTNWGDWGRWEYCPPGTFAQGAALNVQAKQGSGDDTGLNAIKLFCGDPNKPWTPTISSTQSTWGTWLPVTMACPNPLIGFELKSHQYQGRDEDDAGATNIRFECIEKSTFTTNSLCVEFDIKEQSGLDWAWGSWTGLRTCGANHAICGIQTQVAPWDQGDNIALSNVRFACCMHALASEVVEPKVTEAPVTEPKVTEPKVTEAPVVEPKVTEPEMIKPEVTEPPGGVEWSTVVEDL